MIEGAAILAMGLLTGWLGRAAWGRRGRGPRAYICECGHSWSYHSDKGRCAAINRPASVWESDCTCKRYCGPVPLEALGMQQLGGGA